MAIHEYELYLDESGNFESDDLKKNFTPSFVGGVLCRPYVTTQKVIDELITRPIHCMEKYDKAEAFEIMWALRNRGERFVLFENNERVRVLDGDTTYLNIITEGLVKLLRNLRNETPNDKVKINILIATRQNSREREEKGIRIKIAEDEYRRRIEEKMYVYLGRNKIDNVVFEISFDNAAKNKRLMFADIICNTWLSRNGKKKFTDEDRAQIQKIYDGCIRYEVYEDPDGSYLQRLIAEDRIGEAIAQLCSHETPNQNLLAIRDRILERIKTDIAKEREVYFIYMSLKIGQFGRRRDYDAGIVFAEQYKRLILAPLMDMEKVRSAAEYWTFDSDFYLLTMHNHLGNIDKCLNYAKRCNDRIGVISRSWEHLDYYFKFRIRELNMMQDYFDFDGVLEKSASIVEALKTAKEIFPMIDPTIKVEEEKSESLGKIYGVRLQAYINLMHDHPEFYTEALVTSDLALKEFLKASDLERQYQARCSLFVTAGRADDALESLLKSFKIENESGACERFAERILNSNIKKNSFAVLHYTNVMLLMKQKDDPRAEQMKNALLRDQRFIRELEILTDKDAHPWSQILWNIGRYWRLDGNSKKAADERISQAIAMIVKHKTEATMYAFGVCIAADRLAWAMKHDSSDIKKWKREFNNIYNELMQMELPTTMRQRFELNMKEDVSADMLEKLAGRILK